ncbi:NAS30-like protein [Mya arenaria]|uniref:Metalloendopeptidase n=1 Tax=Mya arenaria TaxID=6604 RepID=A0ABY7FYV7_MYAAR|nr:NAS30-like protein [Mya arenaria]
MASTSHQESIRTFIMSIMIAPTDINRQLKGFYVVLSDESKAKQLMNNNLAPQKEGGSIRKEAHETKVMYVCGLAAGQLMMEELQEFNIDPLNLNGTEPENIPRQRRSKSGRKLERHRRKAIRDVVLRWDDGVIPYTFVNGHFSEKEKYMIRTAMTEWEKYTCLRFRPSGRGDRNLVRFQNGLGCNSQLGMVGGSQPLNLDKNGCRFKGLYLHEIGHAIGLVHEHQLPNRDEYIEILYQNVEPSMRIWFNKYSSQEVDQMKVPYEYSSVMHYGITTIRSKQTDKEKNIGRVYRKELSFTDCDSSIVCRNGGYIDQNCKCICPDGTDACTKDKDEPQDRTCFNAHGDDWQCAIWANQGECDRNPRYMTESCKRACKLCGDKSKDDGE